MDINSKQKLNKHKPTSTKFHTPVSEYLCRHFYYRCGNQVQFSLLGVLYPKDNGITIPWNT